MASKEREFLPDIECGVTTTEEEGSKEPVPMSSRGKKLLTRVCSGVLNFNGLVSGESDVDSSDGFTKSVDVSGKMVDVAIERNEGGEDMRELVPLLDKRNPNEKRKKVSTKKGSGKPPRPPKGPVLSAADLVLVKELSELAARKRARIEKMKELRKMKEAKKMSSSSSLAAMLITILFLVVLVFQGVFCRSDIITRKVMGSPAPSVALTGEGLTSAQFFNNAPTNELSGPVAMPLGSWDHTFSSSPREQEGRDIG